MLRIDAEPPAQTTNRDLFSRAGEERGDVHALGAARSDDRGLLGGNDPQRHGALPQAFADRDHAVRHAARRPLGREQQAAGGARRGFQTQTVKGVETVRNAGSPPGQSAEQPGFRRADVTNRRSQVAQ